METPKLKFVILTEKIFMQSVSELVKICMKREKKTAIIVRTNWQIGEVSKELKNRSMPHTSTFFCVKRC